VPKLADAGLYEDKTLKEINEEKESFLKKKFGKYRL
jgi:hypothetical protein